MKYLLSTVIAAALLFSACSKSKTATPKPAEQKETDLTGKWAYEKDTSRWFIVDTLTDSFAVLTFPNPIDAPAYVKGPVTLTYDVRLSGDTIFCSIINIYPCCYFIKSSGQGFAVEYLKIPGQGDYYPLTRL